MAYNVPPFNVKAFVSAPSLLSLICNVAPLATVIAPVPNESLLPLSVPPNKVPALTVVSPV